MKRSVVIREDEWLKELEELFLEVGTGPDDYYSMVELKTKTGHCENWIRTRLQKAMADGRLLSCKKRSIGINGVATWTWAYKVKPE